MTTRFLPILLLALLAAAGLRADEIILKSGKVMTGKITAETDDSYTLNLGPNMFLSIAKSEVSSVSKPKAEAPARSTVRLDNLKSSSTVTTAVSSTTVKPTPSAAKPVAARPPAVKRPATKPPVVHSPAGSPAPHPAVPRPAAARSAMKRKPVEAAAAPADHDVISTETLKIGVAKVLKTSRVRAYDVDGRDFESARRAILDEKSGRGFIDGNKRNAAKSEWEATWTGVPGPGGKQWQSLVVVATITVTRPSWRGLAQAPAAEADKWAAFMKEITEREAGHLAIIHDALMSFGESATNLTEPGEKDLRSDTTAAFKAVEDQALKRRQGFDRRESRPALIPVKKKT